GFAWPPSLKHFRARPVTKARWCIRNRLAADADRPGELRDALQNVGHALEEVDARRALLDDLDRHLADRDPGAVGPDDELAGEHVLLDETRPDDVEEGEPPERLEAVGVGAPEAEGHLEEGRVGDRGRVTDEGALVGRPGGELAADDEVGAAALEDVDRLL